MSEVTLEKLIMIDQKMKAKLSEIAAEEKKIKEERSQIKHAMLQLMNESNLQTATIKGLGTAYIYKSVFASVADDTAFFGWVKEHDAFEALERRVSRSFVQTYMDEHEGKIPPGINVMSEFEVRVRKAD